MQKINDILNESLKDKIETIAPNYKKGMLSEETIDRIIEKVAQDIGTTKSDALAGTIILFLKGAASNGTPSTMSVELRNGKTLAKRNIAGAYLSETGNDYLRRLAEGLAIQIGTFAETHGLNGELVQRINTTLKAETGEVLNPKEAAWCSSFSQHLTDLSARSSERLVKLLAEDYKKRFETKKREKNIKKEFTKSNKNKNKK